MVVHTMTRVGGADEEAAVLVPAEVRDVVALIEKHEPSETAEGFAKLAHATFNNREFREQGMVLKGVQSIRLTAGCCA